MSIVQSTGRASLLDRLFGILRERSEPAESLVHTLCDLASRDGVQIFAVGGLVRDILLDQVADQSTMLDVDLAIDGDPGPLHAELRFAAQTRPTIHDRFGTASISLEDGTHFDIARTRSEHYSSPGALPDVSPAPIEVDLTRRDFTVNAAAVALTGERAGELIDFPHVLPDLERRLLRTLHRGSFRDDPTRLVRAARYASRIGGTIERRTMADARRERRHLTALSPARFGDAWRMLLNEPDAKHALAFARRLQIPQSRERRWLVPRAALEVSESPEEFWSSMGLLIRDRDIAEWLPTSVGMNRRERAALEAGARLREGRRSIAGMKRPSSIARRLRPFQDCALMAAQGLWSGASGAAVADYKRERSGIRSPISAQRLTELGVDPGPRLGQWLEDIEAAIWDGELVPEDPLSVTRMEQRIRLSR
jgi:tRNA nucleotidyltransferase (CCA-adding enzyme)